MSEKDWKDARTVRIRATPKQVWNAWAQPEHIAGWFADRAEGEPLVGSTITHFFDKLGLALPHEVIEATPGERLVLEGVGPGGIPFVQEIRVRADGGHTVLELVHSGFGNDADFDDEYEGIDSGWQLALAQLAHYLERYYGNARTNYFALAPARFTWDQLAPRFRDAVGLAEWLTATGAIGDAGDPVALQLAHGAPLTGRVLARSSREVSVSWAEIDGALELKAFPMGPDRRVVALRASSWSDAPRPVADMEVWMSAACARLASVLG